MILLRYCYYLNYLLFFGLKGRTATMAGRGGGHRRKVEDVDLQEIFTEHIRGFGLSRALNFGIYENIDRSQAAFAAGLAFNKDLLMKASQAVLRPPDAIVCSFVLQHVKFFVMFVWAFECGYEVLEKQPSGKLKPAAVANDVMQASKLFPGLNRTGMPQKLWAGRRVDILCTMLNHLRRVKNDSTRYLAHCKTFSLYQ